MGSLPVGEDCWVSLVLREGALVPVTARTVLQAGDEVVVLAEEGSARDEVDAIFTGDQDGAPGGPIVGSAT